MVTLVVLGPAVLDGWGVGRFYLIHLACGVAGNWVSYLLSPTPAVKAGASGSILGLLGALAGARIRSIRRERRPSRFKTWHIVAMLVAFYGFVIGVGDVDHLAHLGGLLAGVLLAFLLPQRGQLVSRTDRLVDRTLGALAVALAAASALLAYRG